jgi:hypothetical protein
VAPNAQAYTGNSTYMCGLFNPGFGAATANAGTIGTNQDRVQKKAPCNGAIYYSYAVCGQVYKTPGGQHLWQLCTDGSAGITGATFNSAKGHGWDDSAPFSEYLWGYAYFK